MFTSPDEGLLRRSNFRRRVWPPRPGGDDELGWAPIHHGMHFHDLRHTHKTWLIEDHVPRILQLQRMGHKRKDVDDDYSHVTRMMIEAMLAALQQRWEQYGTWTWDSVDAHAELIA